MQFDPLTTYSTLIPGGLHYIPGGLNLPAQSRMNVEDAQPESLPAGHGTTLAAEVTRRFIAGLRMAWAFSRMPAACAGAPPTPPAACAASRAPSPLGMGSIARIRNFP